MENWYKIFRMSGFSEKPDFSEYTKIYGRLLKILFCGKVSGIHGLGTVKECQTLR